MLGFAFALVATAFAGEARAEDRIHKILVRSASVADRKAHTNQPWDVGDPPPDPYVVISVEGQVVHISRSVKSSFAPEWLTGTAYHPWSLAANVKIAVKDADVGKHLAKIGALGITCYPGLPFLAKALTRKVLKEIDTDDDIGVWTGTLGQLVQACGGDDRTSCVLRAGSASTCLSLDRGLRGLEVCVISRPADYSVYAPPPGRECYCGIRSASIALRKQGTQKLWDAGIGPQRNPDPRFLVYVNGDPVLVSPKVPDSHEAVWKGDLPPLYLFPSDVVTLRIVDADLGSEVLGNVKLAAFRSGVLKRKHRKALLDYANRLDTNDNVYVYSTTWAELKQQGPEFRLPAEGHGRGVRVNDGLSRAVVSLRRQSTATRSAMRMCLVVRGVEVKGTKDNGKAWDPFRGKPDPFVVCSSEGEKHGWSKIDSTGHQKDRFQCEWQHEVSSSRLTAGTRLKFDVYDRDMSSHDLVGSVLVTIPDGPGIYRYSGGQVKSLCIEFRRAE